MGSAFFLRVAAAGAADQEEVAELRLLLLVSAGSLPSGKDPEEPPERAALAVLDGAVSRAFKH